MRKCRATAFYDILGIESEKTSVTDNGIKKAYRKLSLLTHPDKNGYDGADEAFKSELRSGEVSQPIDEGIGCQVVVLRVVTCEAEFG